MKGIILAGGMGTRLHPSTISVSKQLLPIYDKPLIYYPLSNLLSAGIRDILIISTSPNIGLFKNLFGNGESLGINISYESQDKPNGIAEAFIIGEKFINTDDVTLILGDNIYYGNQIVNQLKEQASVKSYGAKIFAYKVQDPERYGVVEFDTNKSVVSIEEKPVNPKSNNAVVGVYIYDDTVMEKIKTLKPSARGEYEVTDLNNLYIEEGMCKNVTLKGWWIDAGTPERIIELESKLT